MTHTLNYFHLFSLLLYLGIGIALVVIGADKSWTSVTALGGVLVGFSVIFLGIYIYYKYHPENRTMGSALTMHPGFFKGAKKFFGGKKKKGDRQSNPGVRDREDVFEQVHFGRDGRGEVVPRTSGPVYEETQTGSNPPFDPVYERGEVVQRTSRPPFDSVYEEPVSLRKPAEGSRDSEALRPLVEAVRKRNKPK